MIGFDAVLKSATDLLPQLASLAVRAMAVAGVVGSALVVLRVKSASARLIAWTGVLCAGLAMPFLRLVLPPVQVAMPEVAQSIAMRMTSAAKAARPPVAYGTTEVVPLQSVHDSRVVARPSGNPSNNAHPSQKTRKMGHPRIVSWPVIGFGIYLAVALVLLARFLVGIFFVRRLARAATPIDDPRVNLRLSAHSRSAGMVRVPLVAESDVISVPVTMRVMRPVILLPADWREWDEMKLNAVIAHEVSHAARRDTLTQRLALLHRAIFWFSPLAWWLNRKLAALAEQASDEAALACGADRGAYANVLVEFLEALQMHPGRVWWQGVPMASLDQAEQRVERILTWKGAVPMKFKSWMAVVAVTVALPFVYLTASASPASSSVNAQAVVVHTQTVNAKAAPAPVPPVVAISAPEAPEPGAPVVSVAPPQLPLSWRGQDASVNSNVSVGSASSYSYAYGNDDDDDGLRFVIVSGKSDAVTMSGSSEDVHHALKLKKTISGDFIWFERDEKSYVIRDAATVERARKLWEPQEELGRKQEALGKQQEALGQQQEALGKKMEEVRVSVPDVTPQIDKLRAELKAMGTNASMEQISKVQDEIGELQSKLGELQSHAGEEQGKLGDEMGKLGEQQGKLGEEQGKLGEQQGELARKATRELKSMLDEAISKGTAQPE